jgi:hypothetical protein
MKENREVPKLIDCFLTTLNALGEANNRHDQRSLLLWAAPFCDLDGTIGISLTGDDAKQASMGSVSCFSILVSERY